MEKTATERAFAQACEEALRNPRLGGELELAVKMADIETYYAHRKRHLGRRVALFEGLLNLNQIVFLIGLVCVVLITLSVLIAPFFGEDKTLSLYGWYLRHHVVQWVLPIWVASIGVVITLGLRTFDGLWRPPSDWQRELNSYHWREESQGYIGYTHDSAFQNFQKRAEQVLGKTFAPPQRHTLTVELVHRSFGRHEPLLLVKVYWQLRNGLMDRKITPTALFWLRPTG